MFSFDRNLLNPPSLQILGQQIQKVFLDLEDALKEQPGIQVDNGKGFPRSALGDLLLSQVSGNITFQFVVSEGSKVTVTVGPAITDLNSNYLGLKTSAALPTTLEFPISNNWGFHFNSATNKIYLVYNLNTVIKKVELT